MYTYVQSPSLYISQNNSQPLTTTQGKSCWNVLLTRIMYNMRIILMGLFSNNQLLTWVNWSASSFNWIFFFSCGKASITYISHGGVPTVLPYVRRLRWKISPSEVTRT